MVYLSKAKQKRSRPKQKPIYLNDKRHTAIHEAGHVIIARVLGFHCDHASVLMNEEDGEAGHAAIEQPVEAINRWERQRRYREHRTAYIGYIISLMAGAEANRIIQRVSKLRIGDQHDQRWIEFAAIEAGFRDEELTDLNLWKVHESRMRRQTRRLIRKHRDKIERVAAALLKHGTLCGDKIDKLIWNS